MGERPRTVTVAAPPRSLPHCSRAVPTDHRCADRDNAQNYGDDNQSRSDCGMMIAGNIQKPTTREEYRYQNKGRVKDLHGLVSRWINAAACLCSRRRDIAALIGTFATPCGQPVLEALLRRDGWMVRAQFICQATSHPHTPWGIEIERSDAIGHCRVGFRHIRHAVLRTDRRNDDNLRECRAVYDHSGRGGEFEKGVHFGLLHLGVSRRGAPTLFQVAKVCLYQGHSVFGTSISTWIVCPNFSQSNCCSCSSEIVFFDFDKPVFNALAFVFLAGGVLDFALAAVKQVYGLGPFFTEAVPQGGNRYPTRKKPVPVGHRKANMLSRVRINNRGPARVTDDRHREPQRFLSEPRKHPFPRQRIIETERAAISKFYFLQTDICSRKICAPNSCIGLKRADGSSISAFCNLLIRWHPLAPADALDIAGAA